MKELIVILLLLVPAARGQLGLNENSGIDPLLQIESADGGSNATPRVTAVYGVSADDYLPAKDVARQHLRPKVNSKRTRPAFDLPDAFYFIGGPIFIILFVSVLVIFFNGFEEKRKEEQRVAASQEADPDRNPE